MKFFQKNAGRLATGIGPVVLLLAGCSAGRPSSPISSNRGIETLEMKPGDIPVWRKTGNLLLKPSGKREEDEFTTSIKVTKDKSKRTINASGHEVFITANGTNLTIKGGCAKLLIIGSRNQIKCDFVVKIDVKGEYNSITCDSVSKGVVNGDGNNVAWKRPTDDKIPDIDFTGINNSLEHID